MTALRRHALSRDSDDEQDDVTAGSVDVGGDSVASIADSEIVDSDEDDQGATAPGGDTRRYRVGHEIGAGAMGRVSLVRDLRLLRDVAWKHGDGRILREARILAQLEHPGIVPIYDMGFDRDDRPFFAMRVVSGRSLAQIIKDTPVAERGRLLRPLLQAAEAVAFAHHRGVVHRDLKPANVMIGSFGESQVVDWGLARVLDDAKVPIPDEVRGAIAGSEVGRVGTPGYMSPEQEAGRAADRRSDVYALGRMLGEITGVYAPSDGVPPPPELLAIVGRCLRVDPAERYPDAAAFAADLARYLDGGRVHAHSYGPRELLRRFLKAYRIPLVIAALGFVALSVLVAMYIADIGAERERAESAETVTRTALARSDQYLGRALVGEARRLAAQGARAEAELLAAHAVTLQEDPEARAILSSFAGAPALEVLDRRSQPCPDAQVDPQLGLVLCVRFDGVSLWSQTSAGLELAWRVAQPLHVARLVEGGVVIGSLSEITLLDLEGRVVLRAATPVNPSGRTAAIASLAVVEGNGISVLADVARGIIEGVTPCQGALHGALVPTIDNDVPGIAAAICKDGTLRMGDLAVQTALVAPEREGVRIAAAGTGRFVVGTNKGEVVILDTEGRVERSSFAVDGMVRLLSPAPDGRMALVAGEGEPILIVTLPELARVASLPRRVKDATWDPTRPGELVTTGAWLERWRLAPSSSDRPLRGAYFLPSRDGVVSLDIDPTHAERVAVAHGPHAGVLTPSAWVEASPGYVTVKAASPDGERITVAGAQRLLRLDADSLELREDLRNLSVRRLVTLADGRSLVATYDALLRLEGDRFELVDRGPPIDLSAAPNRRFAVMLRETDHALLRVTAHDAGIELVGFDPLAEAVAIGNDGERIFTARAGEVVVWDELGFTARILRAGDAHLMDVAVSGEGRWVAAGSRDGAVFLWGADDPEPRARFLDHHERVPALAFSADGRWLASGSWDRTLRVRDLNVVDAPAGPLRADIARRYGMDLSEALGGVALGTGLRTEAPSARIDRGP